MTAENNYAFTHMGAVFLNAGKVMFGAADTLEFSAGPQRFIDYYYTGNTAGSMRFRDWWHGMQIRPRICPALAASLAWVAAARQARKPKKRCATVRRRSSPEERTVR